MQFNDLDPFWFCFAASLQDENKVLKTEYCRLASTADDIEAQEQRLLKDLTGQLSTLIFYYVTCLKL